MKNLYEGKARRWLGVAAVMLWLTVAPPHSRAQDADPNLRALLVEAGENNPEIQAARREFDAARSRIAPAAALDDPMLEAGVVNVPAQSLSLRREDMTMKMIGVTQRLPYPGKRALRREMAEKEAEAGENTLRDLVNRVQRDLKIAYLDLGLADESIRLLGRNREVLEQLLSIAESRYSVGQGSQADVLKAQTQLSKMLDEQIKLGRERPVIEAELNRALGRAAAPRALTTSPPALRERALRVDELRALARRNRPQLLAQRSTMDRSTKALELAKKDYYPDFDVRLQYGQRDNFEGLRREDMITFTVAINLPVWGESKREPRISEAEAMREQAARMYDARLNEIDTMLRQQVATAEQALKSVRLYETAILPQARLAVEASLAAYRVGRVDFLTLLDSQMTVFNYEIGHAANVTSHNKALAEIEFLTGGTR
jgi:cobalt-zinc-cadmium efflux system outer membrane protein